MVQDASSTIDPREVQQFSDIAHQWWHEKGPFSPLHQMNPCRLGFIKDTLGDVAGLQGLDVGCGGGLLTEALCRMGIRMTGIDASDKAIEVALAHRENMGLTIEYICQSIEEHIPLKRLYDVIFALEIIEHVASPIAFIDACAALLKPGGSLFISTLNRTIKSYLIAIIGGEYIAKKLPKGTHDWNKFITPGEIGDLLRPHGLTIQEMRGMEYNPLKESWTLTSHSDVNYILRATKSFT